MAGGSIGIFFLLLSFFSKKEDYMLDDYTEDDKPDNVRIIEREIPKIIEKEIEKEVIKEVPVEVIKEVEKEVPIEKEVIKEVIKEVPVEVEVIKEVTKEVPVEVEVIKEVEIINKEEEDRLRTELSLKNKKISELKNNNSDLEKLNRSNRSKILSLESRIELLQSDKEESDSKVSKLNKEIEDFEEKSSKYRTRVTKLKLELDKVNNNLNDIQGKYDQLSTEKDKESKLLKSKIQKLRSNNDLLNNSIKEGDKENNEIIQKLRKEKEEKNVLIQNLESEIETKDNKIKQIISDRDHFLKVAENKGKEIDKLKDKLSKMEYTHDAFSYVYEGVDDIGKFFDVQNLNGNIPSENINEILEINESLDIDHFAYFSVNTLTNHKGHTIYGEENLKDMVDNLNSLGNKSGKYRIYLIYRNRVYLFLKH